MKLISLIKKILPQRIKQTRLINQKRLEYKSLIIKTQLHYNEVITALRERKNQKIRFGSYVVFDSTFAAKNCISIMKENPMIWSFTIVICPDITRGNEFMLEQYEQTKQYFINQYGTEHVIDGYNTISKEFVDCSELFDVVYCANPYDLMVHKFHSIAYLSTKNVLPFYLSYGCMPDKYSCKFVMPLPSLSLAWKIFADTKQTVIDYRKNELFKGKNVVLSGFSKMDDLEMIPEEPHSRKRIIIAPHHTVRNEDLPLSNFLSYYDLILKLPVLFPDIDFVFRPHPLLFVALVNNKIWTSEQVEKYLTKIKEVGIKYSAGGGYLSLFKNSDAIIHDCSSFVVEYLFTGHPCCFVMRSKKTKKIFSRLGRDCLKFYTIAYSENDIIKFISNIKNNKMNNKQISKKIISDVMVNYPFASNYIVAYIAKQLIENEGF